MIIDAVVGETATLATGATATVMAEVPAFPSLVAVMVVLPAATAVTTPDVETVATPVALLDQVTARPVSTALLASVSVAVNACVPPTIIDALVGETATFATGATATVIAEVPDLVSLVAVIVALPAPTAVTTPLADTVATAVALLNHVVVRPVSACPPASVSAAVSV
jgi:hypothetical protein